MTYSDLGTTRGFIRVLNILDRMVVDARVNPAFEAKDLGGRHC